MTDNKLYFKYTDQFNELWQKAGLTNEHKIDFETAIKTYHLNLPANNHGSSFPVRLYLVLVAHLNIVTPTRIATGVRVVVIGQSILPCITVPYGLSVSMESLIRKA